MSIVVLKITLTLEMMLLILRFMMRSVRQRMKLDISTNVETSCHIIKLKMENSQQIPINMMKMERN